MKKIIVGIVSVFVFCITANQAFAHVVVKPGEVGIGQRLNFTVSVPTEEDTPTIQVRLVIPNGLQSVRPNVKPGWTIQLIKTGEGEDSKVSEIIWSGGSIPAEQRDEFIFSAQAPAEEATLIWKAYQTYGDGDIVAWEADPKMVEEYSKNNPLTEGEEDDHNAPRPYSTTQVINDLKTDTSSNTTPGIGASTNGTTLSLIAIVLAGVSLGMQFMKKK